MVIARTNKSEGKSCLLDRRQLRETAGSTKFRVFASSFRCRARNFLIALNNVLRDGIPRASPSERLFEVAVKKTAP